MRNVTRVRNESIADLYQAGGSLNEIGNLVGLSRERVRQILSLLDVDRRPTMQPAQATLDAVKDILVGDGAVSIIEASAAYGAQQTGVSAYLRTHHPEFDYRARRRAFHEANTPHGTVNRYQNYGCRCQACTAANTARCEAWKKKAAERTPPDHVHGTLGGYRNWSCRCDACTEANTAACREYHERQGARK